MADADQPVIEFRCRRCQKELSSPKSKVGTEGVCPQCQLTYEVPAESTTGPVEEYGVAEGDGPSAAESPPEEPPKEEPPKEEPDIYAIREEPVAAEAIDSGAIDAEVLDEASSPPPEETQQPVAEKPAAETGKPDEPPPEKPTVAGPPKEEAKLDSPIPDSPSPIPDPRSPIPDLDSPKPQTGAEEEPAGKATTKPAERAEYQAGIDYRTGRPRYEEVEDYKKIRYPDPPPRPLIAGIFDLPFRSEARLRMILLSAGAFPVLLLLRAAHYYSTLPALGYYDIGVQVAGLMFTSTGLLALVMWSGVMAVHFYAIVTDVSRGIDDVVNWPKGVFIEWVQEGLFVLLAFLMSAAPGAILSQGLYLLGVPALYSHAATLFSIWLLFPFVMVSVLEENTLTSPFSARVWESVKRSRRWWMLFYLESGALFVAGAGILLAVYKGIGLLVILAALIHMTLKHITETVFPLLLLVLASGVMTYYIIVYSRLLGRLAWVCSAEAMGGESEEDPS